MLQEWRKKRAQATNMIHDINTAILVHRTICGEAIREAIYERGNSQSNCKTVAIDEYLAVSFPLLSPNTRL